MDVELGDGSDSMQSSTRAHLGIQRQHPSAQYELTSAQQDGSSAASTGGSSFMQGFSLPGESEKAAKILKHFLGESIGLCTYHEAAS